MAFRAALKRLRPTADDVFVDIGSGKGQAIIAAAQLPIARAIGVELAEDLTAVARANLARVQARLRCPHIELVNADAVEWPIPDDVSIIYLYCPFIGDLFAALAGLLCRFPRHLPGSGGEWRTGDRTVIFPVGCYPPALPFVSG